MPSHSLSAVVQQLRATAERDETRTTDGELLTRFLNRRNTEALEALVARHAPMVWSVCCRLLRDPLDAEDAFQATFLVLVQKAVTVAPRERVANWLYGVAQQTAVRLRAAAAKRGVREVPMNPMPEPAGGDARDDTLLALLDQELSRLPERSRTLIVLCDLEGRTRKQVAQQLGCPEGTVASGLARARQLLAKRLGRHGLSVSGGGLTTLSHSAASAGVPARVVTTTIHVATRFAAGDAIGLISGPVAALTQEVLKTMLLNKIMTLTMVVLVLSIAAVTGANLALGQTEKPNVPDTKQDVKPPPAGKPAEPPATVKKEPITAWGKEVGGLQAGLELRPGERRTYRYGETITLIIRVRNVGKEPVKFQYLKQFLDEEPPVVTDAKGTTVAQSTIIVEGFHIPVDVTLEPGQEIELESRMRGTAGLRYELTPTGAEGKRATKEPPLKTSSGKIPIQFERVLGNSSSGVIEVDPALNSLATGKLEIEIKDAPADPKQTLTPQDAIRIANDIQLTKRFNETQPPVEFRIDLVDKSVRNQVVQVPKDAVWVKGHGPDDVRLLAPPPADGAQVRLAAILTADVVKRLNRAGITDLEKHFKGKTIRITGTLSKCDHNLYGTPAKVDILIDDINKLEVIK